MSAADSAARLPGTVPGYRLAVPHFWEELVDQKHRAIAEMCSLTHHVRHPGAHVVGHSSAEHNDKKRAIRSRNPDFSEYMVSLLLYQEEQRTKQLAEEERGRLTAIGEARAEAKVKATLRRLTVPPILVDREGRMRSLSNDTRQWLLENEPAELVRWESMLSAARQCERDERFRRAADLEAARQSATERRVALEESAYEKHRVAVKQKTDALREKHRLIEATHAVRQCESEKSAAERRDAAIRRMREAQASVDKERMASLERIAESIRVTLSARREAAATRRAEQEAADTLRQRTSPADAASRAEPISPSAPRRSPRAADSRRRGSEADRSAPVDLPDDGSATDKAVPAAAVPAAAVPAAAVPAAVTVDSGGHRCAREERYRAIAEAQLSNATKHHRSRSPMQAEARDRVSAREQQRSLALLDEYAEERRALASAELRRQEYMEAVALRARSRSQQAAQRRRERYEALEDARLKRIVEIENSQFRPAVRCPKPPIEHAPPQSARVSPHREDCRDAVDSIKDSPPRVTATETAQPVVGVVQGTRQRSRRQKDRPQRCAFFSGRTSEGATSTAAPTPVTADRRQQHEERSRMDEQQKQRLQDITVAQADIRWRIACDQLFERSLLSSAEHEARIILRHAAKHVTTRGAAGSPPAAMRRPKPLPHLPRDPSPHRDSPRRVYTSRPHLHARLHEARPASPRPNNTPRERGTTDVSSSRDSYKAAEDAMRRTAEKMRRAERRRAEYLKQTSGASATLTATSTTSPPAALAESDDALSKARQRSERHAHRFTLRRPATTATAGDIVEDAGGSP